MMNDALMDSIPPQHIEAEKSVLGALLLDWDKMNDVAVMLTSDRFFSYQNKTIYECMLSLFKQNVHADTLAILDELEKIGKVAEAGGKPYVISLSSIVPTSANINYYVEIILDRASRRDIIALGEKMKGSAHDMSRQAKVLLEESEQDIFKLSDRNVKTRVQNMKEVMMKTITLIERNVKEDRVITGIPSGFVKLDNMTYGFQKSEMTIIGARPSIGKTAFALSMMEEIAIKKKIPCGFFSLEMSSGSIAQRLLSQISKISSSKIRSGHMSDAEFRTLQNVAGACYTAPLFVVDTPNMQLLDLRSMARKMRVNQEVEIIFIDYIGLITTENINAPVYETQSEISKSLKSLARELEIPIVALCQVARDAEGKEPTLAQLRGSGSIEQDADVVMFLHRERQNPDKMGEAQEAKCIIAKQRNGATGEIKMMFFPMYTRFENKIEE